MPLSDLKDFAKAVQKFRKDSPKAHYPKDFQKTVQKLIESGYPMNKISQVSGIHLGTIRKWKDFDKKEVFVPTVVVDDTELSNLTVITGIKPQDLRDVLQSLQ